MEIEPLIAALPTRYDSDTAALIERMPAKNALQEIALEIKPIVYHHITVASHQVGRHHDTAGGPRQHVSNRQNCREGRVVLPSLKLADLTCGPAQPGSARMLGKRILRDTSIEADAPAVLTNDHSQ